MAENRYQKHVIDRLRVEFPGCVVLKNDSGYQQGIPDLTILHKEKWALLEVKDHENASVQPNQGWWVDHLDELSYASFVYPENEEEVFLELQQALQPRRSSQLSRR